MGMGQPEVGGGRTCWMGPWSVLQPHLTAWPVEVQRPQMTSCTVRLSPKTAKYLVGMPQYISPHFLMPRHSLLVRAPFPRAFRTGGIQALSCPISLRASPSAVHICSFPQWPSSVEGEREEGRQQFLNSEGSHCRAGLAAGWMLGQRLLFPEAVSSLHGVV